MEPVIIIGTGLAGYTLAKELRKLNNKIPLLMATADDGRYYSKPMLSSALAQGKNIPTLTLASASEMSQTLKAQIFTYTRVNRIDPQARRIQVDHQWLDYHALVIAVGANPIRLPLTGSGASDVLSINNLGDYARFRLRLEEADRIAIIGPGLIGCEFANDLLSVGKQVTVIGPDPFPISTLLPEAAGLALQSGLQKAGVEWQLNTTAQEVEKTKSGIRVRLENGTTLESDLILSAVGLRPDISLASNAGLTVNRGIVTDRKLQTSAPGIYALGDCAEVDGLNLPFVAPMMAGARALARTLLGQATRVAYPAMPVVIKTTCHPVVVAPPIQLIGEWKTEHRGDGVRALYEAPNGDLLGFALTGPAVEEKQALTRRLPPMFS